MLPRLQTENAFGKILELYLELKIQRFILRKYHGWSPDSVLETHFNKGENLPTKICFQGWNIRSQDSKCNMFLERYLMYNLNLHSKFIFNEIIQLESWRKPWLCFGNALLQMREFTSKDLLSKLFSFDNKSLNVN